VLPGFGKLVKQKRKARTGINPKTLQKIKIPAPNTEARLTLWAWLSLILLGRVEHPGNFSFSNVPAASGSDEGRY